MQYQNSLDDNCIHVCTLGIVLSTLLSTLLSYIPLSPLSHPPPSSAQKKKKPKNLPRQAAYLGKAHLLPSSSNLIPHSNRITPHLILLPTRHGPIAEAALLPPTAAVAVFFVELADGAQSAHVLADARADFLEGFGEVFRAQGALFGVFVFGCFVVVIGGGGGGDGGVVAVVVFVAVILRLICILVRLLMCGRGRGVEFLAHAREGGGDANVLQVGARVKGGLGREVGDGDFGVEEFGFEMDLENGFSVLLRGQIHEDAARQSTEGRFVEVKGTIGGDHDEGGGFRYSVPFAEELVYKLPVTGPTAGAATRTEDSVCFVDEDDARGEFFG